MGYYLDPNMVDERFDSYDEPDMTNDELYDEPNNDCGSCCSCGLPILGDDFLETDKERGVVVCGECIRGGKTC